MKNNLPLKLALLLTVLIFSGCAVMDKNIPGWAQYRNPDKTNALELASWSSGTGTAMLMMPSAPLLTAVRIAAL